MSVRIPMKAAERRWRAGAGAFAVVVSMLVAATAADAAGYPDRAIRIVVPYAPGGPTDLTARRLAESISTTLGQPVIVENRTGGATMVAADYVARAPKDGYTLLLAASTTLSANPHLYPHRITYRLDDFVPVALANRQAFVLTLAGNVPARTVEQFVAYGRSKPDGVTFGTTGTGSLTHVVGEWIGSALGVTMREVPYKGTAQSTLDLLGERLDAQTEVMASAVPLHRSGKARVFAVMASQRSPMLPDVPTFAELGYPDLVAYTWFGLVAPAGTPRAVVDKLNAAANKATGSREFIAQSITNGEIPGSGTPEEFGKLVRSEYEKWGRLIKPLGLKLD